MASTGRPHEGVRRALLGALEGAVLVGVSLFVGLLVTGQGTAEAGLLGLLGGVLGAVIFATGRGLTGRLWGPALGGLAGLLLGAYCGQRFLGDYTYEEPAVVQAGEEVEVAGPTVQGPPFDLRRLRGKVVLVDFWATWCEPCVEELPHVRAVYDRYHAKGFEVVGVSLDNSRQRLEEFIREHKIPWPQVFFDYPGQRGWANPVAQRYGLHGIPAMVLVDPEGHVVPGNVRGEALGPAVARLLDGGTGGPEPPPPPKTEIWVVAGFSPWLLAGAFLGGLAGTLAGALAEWAVRRRTQGPAAPPQTPA
jgi:thiol-disulfide isomerase/thioredoxin